MYQGKSLNELATEIERQATAKRDFVGSSTDLQMGLTHHLGDPEDETVKHTTMNMMVGLNSFKEIEPQAHAQFASRLGIPKRYYDKMLTDSPQLLADNVNHWLHDKPENRLTRTLDGRVRAFLSDRFRPLDNDLVAQFVLPVIGEMGVEVSSCEVTPRRLYIKVTMPMLSREVKLGDVVQAGLIVSNSETGLGSVSILPQILRLVCMNGMTVNDFGMKKYHIGKALGSGEDNGISEWFATDTIEADNKAFVLKLRDSVRGILSRDVFNKITDRLVESAEAKLTGHPEKIVEVVKEKVGLSDGEGAGVLRHLIDGGDLSMWGLANAVTAEANTAKDYDRATELESYGGRLIELPKDQWKEIAAAA